MRVPRLASLAVLLALGLPAGAAAPVPRASPELTITDPSGTAMSLSSLKGHVVVIEFLWVRCPSCLRMAQTINKLHDEMADRGFEAVAVAFDEGISAPAVRSFAQLMSIKYPVGYTTSDQVDRYLGRDATERIHLPQLVVIDRAGVIRAQSLPTGEAELTDETHLRNLVHQLLDEGAPPGKSENSAPRPAG